MLRWRVLGIQVVVNWSWLLVLALLAWSLAGVQFPLEFPGLSGSAYAVMGVAASLLFFASVLVHELSHSLVSLHEGVPVRRITLFLFGGASEAAEPLPGPTSELRVVAAGPLSTAALTGVLWLLAEVGRAVGLPVEVTGVVAYLAELNLVLLVFNLLPALPLDGGRLVHAWLWHRRGDPARATLVAARGGQVLAYGLLALGTLGLSAGSTAAVWLLLLGGFLLMTVQQELRAARLQLAFAGLTVADVMTTDPVTLSPDLTVAGLGELLRTMPSHPVYPVVEQGRLVGLLVLAAAGRVPLERRGSVSVREVMLTPGSAPVLAPELPVREAVRPLSVGAGRAAVVDEHEHLLGLLSQTDLLRLADHARSPAA